MQKPKSIALILGVLAMSFLVGYLAIAFTDAPAGTPPYCPAGYPGCDQPINVGSTGQVKTGTLRVGGLTSDSWTYLATQSGNVGIGTAAPGAKLEIAGQVKITGGSPGAGKILTSDAAGLASWQTITGTLPSGSSGQTLRNDGTNWVANSVIYNNGTNVGIGTAAPGYKLDISGDVRWTGTLQGGSVPWARLTSFPSACSSGQYVSAVGSSLTCSAPAGGGDISGSGTTNYLAKFTGTKTIGNSLIFDNGTSVGIGTAAPGAKLEIAGQVKITGGSPGAGKILTSDAAGLASWQTPALAGGTPTGGIIMYSGAWNFDGTGLGTGSLAGWALCNGNNGTPNLSDRFVMGTINSATLKATGGANSYTLTVSQLPSHTHTFTTDSAGAHSHIITINSAGAHTHTVSDISCRFANYGACLTSGTDKCRAGQCSRTTDSQGSHTHTASISTSGSHTHSGTTNSVGSNASIDNRPAFIQLAFIMKL